MEQTVRACMTIRNMQFILKWIEDTEYQNDVNNLHMLTPDYRPRLSKGIKAYSELDNAKKTELSRASVDFIAGMMDDFAKGTYERYYGIHFDRIPIVGREFSIR